jgi:hypothetical protein
MTPHEQRLITRVTQARKRVEMSDIEEVLRTQVSEQFLKGMVARMEMSYFKYGDVREGFPHKIDALASLSQRLEKYRDTGNTEFLMDAANFAMIEFMLPRHPKAFFEATDSDQSPGRTTTYGTVTAEENVKKHVYAKDGD